MATYTLEGKTYTAPDDWTIDQVLDEIERLNAPPENLDVVRAVPGTAKRQGMKFIAGAHRMLGDVLGNEEMQRSAAGATREIEAEAQLETPKNMTLLQEGMLSGGASALNMLPAMALAAPIGAGAAATKGALEAAKIGVGALTTLMGVQTGVSRYGDLREAGFTPMRSGLHGAFEGIVEKYTEHLPMKELVQSPWLWKHVVNFMWKEGLGEQVATLLQDVSAKLSDRPEMTIGDYLRDAAVTAIATPIAGGLQVAGVTGARGLLGAVAGGPPPTPAPPTPTPPPTGAAPTPPPAPPVDPTQTIPGVGALATPPAAVPPSPPQPVVATPPPTVPETTLTRLYVVPDSEQSGTVLVTPDKGAALYATPTSYIDVPKDRVADIRAPFLEADPYFRVTKTPDLTFKPIELTTVTPPVVAAPAPATVPGVDLTPPVKQAASVPAQPTVTVPVTSQALTASELEFPDALSQILWNYGNALLRVETTLNPPSQEKLTRLRDEAKSAAGVKSDVEIAKTAGEYVRGVIISGAKTAEGKFTVPPIEQVLGRARAHEAEINTAVAMKIKPGQVALHAGMEATPWVKTMQAYMQAWVRTFSPHMKVVLIRPSMEAGERATASYYGGVHIVQLPQEGVGPVARMLGLYVLAHEFGHMLIHQHLHDPKYASQYEALRQEYLKFVSGIKGASAISVLRAGQSPIQLLGDDVAMVERAEDYIRALGGPSAISFDEWLADQMVRYMHTNRSYLEIPNEKAFWKPLFEKLKAFFDKVVKKFAPTETYSAWVEQLKVQDSNFVAPPGITHAQKEIGAKPGVNFGRLTTLLGAKLYGNPSDLPAVSIKEMVQNSFDAVKGAIEAGSITEGKIDIWLDDAKRVIRVTDNGSGMAPETLATAFLQIAGTEKTTTRASGGLGIAKGLFLYGNERIRVMTRHNGTESRLDTTGEALMAAADGQAEPVKIQVDVTTAPNGTQVEVVVPKDYVDPSTGKTEKIYFNEYSVPSVLELSPLLEPVTVTVTRGILPNRATTLPIGKNFPVNNYSHFAHVTFPSWGAADVYVSKEERTETYGQNLHVLSNGLWQFSERIAANPFEVFGKPVPRTMYINVMPRVKADDPGYPFDLNRQRFSTQGQADLDAIKAYLSLTYRKQETAEMATSYGALRYIDSEGGLSDVQQLAPQMTPQMAGSLFTVTENDTVEVREGKLYVNNRLVPTLTKEDMKTAADTLSEFVIEQNTIRPDWSMLHDNVLIKTTETNFTPFVDYVMSQFGQRFVDAMHAFNGVFKDVIARLAREERYNGLLLLGNGVSFDEDYHGVHFKVPFRGMLINPASYNREDYPTTQEMATAMWLTMVHEISHTNDMDHTASFVSALQRNLVTLEKNGVAVEQKRALMGVLEEYKEIFDFIQEEFHVRDKKPAGKHLPDVAYDFGGTSGSVDVAGTGERTGGAGALYEATEEFPPDPRYGPVRRRGSAARAVEIEKAGIKRKSQARDELSQHPNDKYEYTLRVLDRLPKKQTVKKLTIYGELGRQDVRKEERELIGKVLKEFPGESVDRQLFAERVLGEIVPLQVNVTDEYAGYGLASIGMAKYRSFASTNLWVAPGLGYVSPHFPDVNDVWGWTRGFDGVAGEMRSVIEIQADAEQHAAVVDEDRAQLETELQDAREEWATWQEVGELLNSPGDTRLAALKVLETYYGGPVGTSALWALTPGATTVGTVLGHPRTPEEMTEVTKQVTVTTQHVLARSQDLEARLSATRGEVFDKLPKRWWELMLRHEVTLAARRGMTTMRVATADTVAKVEGWPVEYILPPGHSGVVEVPNLRDKEVLFAHNDDASYKATGRILNLYDPNGGGTTWVPVVEYYDVRKPNVVWTTNLEDATFAAGVSVNIDALFPNVKKVYGDQQGIYDRYAKDITPFVKREYGAKEITDEKGNTWLEFDLNTALADLPITYYNLARAVEETGNQIAARAGVPELPASFTRFQGFLQNTLQLNQMAKLLPQVEGFQRYRLAMRALHAFKAKLFEGPNDRIHEWHKLGWKEAKAVEQALADERMQGEHWTQLRQVPVEGTSRLVWMHVPDAGFEKLMNGRGVGPEGQKLFLGVKNDFLSTLQAMEDVVRQHTEKFFADNLTVREMRLNAITSEFKALRETPYLPDTRFGQYSVQIRAGNTEVVDGREIKKGDLVYWEKFENKRSRDRKFAALKRQFPQHSVSASYDSELVSTLRGVPQSVLEAVVETLNQNESTRLSPDQMDALKQIEFDQTAAGKFAKYLRTPAQHLAGYSKDLRRAYAAYHWKTANAIAKLKYVPELTSAMQRVRNDARTIRVAGGLSDSYDKLVEYLQRNFTYVMQPQHEFEQLRALVSMWYLWGSAKTAVMNMTSVPVLTYPYLAQRFGDGQATAALLRAMKDVVQFWRDPTKLTADRQRVLEKFKADGATDQSFASMLASVTEGGVAFERMIPAWEWMGSGDVTNIARRTAWKVSSLGMLPFRVVEQLNRQITGLAAYDLMSKKTGKTLSQSDTEAYDFARDAIDYTQNEYGAWNRPRFMMGKQSVFLLFFSFVQNMSFMMFGGDKSWWRAMMVLAALGGLQGLPGMDNIIDMLNWALRKLTGEYVDLRNEARDVAVTIGANPDLVMHGISHNWLGLGWDTSASLGAGRIIPGTDAIFGIGKFEHRFLNAASEIGGPVGSLMISFMQALADDNPNALAQWDRALPPVLRNIERSWNAYEMQAWATQKGMPLAGDPTAVELFGQTLGFAPTRKVERQAELRAARDIATYYNDRRSNLLEAMFMARRTRDAAIVAEARDAIQEYNAKVPEPALRITSADIERSMKSREKQVKETEELQSPIRRYREIYRYIDGLY